MVSLIKSTTTESVLLTKTTDEMRCFESPGGAGGLVNETWTTSFAFCIKHKLIAVMIVSYLHLISWCFVKYFKGQ